MPNHLLKMILPALLAIALPAHADEWADLVTVSSTLGLNANRLCMAAAGHPTDIGCPAAAPYLDPSSGSLKIGPGATSYTQTDAALSLRATTYGTGGEGQNSLEWGHSNQNGYGSTIGFLNGGGQPFIAFDGEGGTNINTYRTRGKWPVILTNRFDYGNNGGLVIGTVGNINADNQSLVPLALFTVSGTVGIGTITPNAKLDVVGTVSATHFVGDGSALTGVAGDNLGNHTATQDLAMGANTVVFGSTAGDKETYYSNGYGRGIESGTLTDWSNSQFRWRIGGTSVSTGSQQMLLNSSGLAVSAVVSASSNIYAPEFISTANLASGGGGNFVMSRNDSSHQVLLGISEAGSQRYTIGMNAGETRMHFDEFGASNGFYFNNGIEINGAVSATSFSGISANNYGVRGQTSKDILGGVIGYAANGSNYGILGYDNLYALYGNGQLYVSGNMATPGSVTAVSFNQSSDRRLKKNIKTAKGLAVVDKLRGVTFTWKKDGKPSAGVIAQEVEKVMPSAVGTNNQGMKTVNYDELIAPLIEAVKELHRDNDNLRAELHAMERRSGLEATPAQTPSVRHARN